MHDHRLELAHWLLFSDLDNEFGLLIQGSGPCEGAAKVFRLIDDIGQNPEDFARHREAYAEWAKGTIGKIGPVRHVEGGIVTPGNRRSSNGR